MRLIIQRVNRASVKVDNINIADIKKGFLIFIAFCKGDLDNIFENVIDKLLKLRIFEDEQGKMNLNINEVNGKILLVSQFTLCADNKKGNRPSFDNSMEPNTAREYFDKFYELLNSKIETKKGQFGAYMQIELINDGPATFIMEF